MPSSPGSVGVSSREDEEVDLSSFQGSAVTRPTTAEEEEVLPVQPRVMHFFLPLLPRVLQAAVRDLNITNSVMIMTFSRFSFSSNSLSRQTQFPNPGETRRQDKEMFIGQGLTTEATHRQGCPPPPRFASSSEIRAAGSPPPPLLIPIALARLPSIQSLDVRLGQGVELQDRGTSRH